MVDVFCIKYLHGEETVTLATRQATKQRNGEDLMKYIKRFRGIALDCSVRETQFRQTERTTGYGRVHWKPEKENRGEGV